MFKLPTLKKYISDNYGKEVLNDISSVVGQDILTVSDKPTDLKQYAWNIIYHLDKRLGSRPNSPNRLSTIVKQWYQEMMSIISESNPRFIYWSNG